MVEALVRLALSCTEVGYKDPNRGISDVYKDFKEEHTHIGS